MAVPVCLKGQSPTRQKRAKRQRGFVLIATAISMTLLLGLAALSIDLGRMYVIRAELQSFTDAAALTAARSFDGRTFDGSPASLDRARAAAQSLAKARMPCAGTLGRRPSRMSP